MKKVIIGLLLLINSGLAFSQSINLPGAVLPPVKKTKISHPTTSRADDSNKPDPDAPTSSQGNTTYKYSAQVLSTNFTIPIVRVNFLVNKPQNAENQIASTSFFNSVGAGLSYSWGEIERTQDSGGNDITTSFVNDFGIQAGVLFAANGGSGTSSNQSGASTNQPSTVFAIVGGITILNFQLGAGYELGSLPSGQRRGFMTIAYAIPLSDLIKGGYKIFSPNQKAVHQ